MKVKDIMKVNPITLSTNMTLRDAAEVLEHSNGDSIPIIDENHYLVGTISNLQLFQTIEEGKSLDTSVIELMNTSIECLKEEVHAKLILEKKGNSFPVINRNNQFVGMLYKTDILTTYYRKVTHDMHYLNTALDSTSNGIIVINNKLEICFFNKAAKELLEIEDITILGKSILEVFPSSTLPYTIETGKIEKGKTVSQNGKRMISNRAPIIYENKIIGAVAIFQDITDYNNLLERLDEQKNVSDILNTILETVYDGIVVIDKEGYITMMSKAYTRFLGIDHKDVIGRHVTEMIENTRMDIALKTGRSEIAQLQEIKGDYMIASRIPIVKDGEVIGVVGKVLFRNVEDLHTLHKRINKMDKELARYKGEWKNANKAYYSFEHIIGKSKEIKAAISLGKMAACSTSNVLLLGESGTGKELFAHAIHQLSNRSHMPFVKVNCAAIPNELLESELFGYEGGSFTGAQKKGKAGKFKVADGGTIFLDEIGDMALQMQAKLLRVLQEKEIEKIGSTVAEKVDIRIIAATNQNLEDLVERGKFRADLFYRLNVVTIQIPPLRDRKGDIEILTQHLVDKLCNSMGKYVERVSREAMKYLNNYNWPGNIRELENILERAVNIIDKEVVIKSKHLPKEITGSISLEEIRSLRQRVEETEKESIAEALQATNGNKTKAAKLLDISRASLYEKIQKYHL